MARFPSVPGAGPKSINNPVYWSRMHLQNQRYAQSSQGAVERFNERKTRLFNTQNHLSEHIYDVLVDCGVTQKMSESEWSKWCELLNDMKYWSEYCEKNVETATQADLSKWATRIKRFVIYMLKTANKYGAFTDSGDPTYDKKRAMIVAGGEDICYLGK